jgi:tetratricopeptide (TPR) repeat protein
LIPQQPILLEIASAADQLLARGEFRAVMAVCGRALHDHGDHPRIRIARARALMAMRRHREAERDLALAIRLDPGSAMAHRLLCEIALCRGDLGAAEVFLDRALRLDPAHPRARELAEVACGWRERREARAHRRGPRRAA